MVNDVLGSQCILKLDKKVMLVNLYFLMLVELYRIAGRSNIFSYSYGELRMASDNFNPTNLLGEGGYGSVYKVSSFVVHMNVNLL
jgi:hypothetical protein